MKYITEDFIIIYTCNYFKHWCILSYYWCLLFKKQWAMRCCVLQYLTMGFMDLPPVKSRGSVCYRYMQGRLPLARLWGQLVRVQLFSHPSLQTHTHTHTLSLFGQVQPLRERDGGPLPLPPLHAAQPQNKRGVKGCTPKSHHLLPTIWPNTRLNMHRHTSTNPYSPRAEQSHFRLAKH